MREASATSASSRARQTSSTGAPARRAAGPEVLVAAGNAASGLRMFTPILTGANNKGPGKPGPLLLVRYRRLLQRVVDRGELGVQVGTKAVHDSDNRERNAGSNQAVFDGGSAGLVLNKTRNQILHW